jgi:hypothetical protein
MTVEFIVGDEWQDSGGKLVYRDAEHSFDFEGERPNAVASLLVNDLQLEITEGGVVLYPWGYCPRATWQTTEADPPRCTRGTLNAQLAEEVVPGVSKRISGDTRWPVYENARAGWICVGDPKAAGDRDGGIEFAPGCVAVLQNHRLVALWLHPASRS